MKTKQHPDRYKWTKGLGTLDASLKIHAVYFFVVFKSSKGFCCLASVNYHYLFSGFIFPYKVSGFLEGTLSDELIQNYRDDLDFQNLIGKSNY